MRLIAYSIFLLTNLIVLGVVSDAHRYGVLGNLVLTGLLSFITILMHELGHAGAVWSLRGRVIAIAAGPLILHPRPFRIGAAPSYSGGDVGGFVSYSFDGWETSRKDLIVAVAGPGANFILALAAGLIASFLTIATHASSTTVVVVTDVREAIAAATPIAIPNRPEISWWMIQRTWQPIFAALAILSAGIGLANLIPYDGSDGNEIWRLLRHRLRRR